MRVCARTRLPVTLDLREHVFTIVGDLDGVLVTGLFEGDRDGERLGSDVVGDLDGVRDGERVGEEVINVPGGMHTHTIDVPALGFPSQNSTCGKRGEKGLRPIGHDDNTSLRPPYAVTVDESVDQSLQLGEFATPDGGNVGEL